MSTSRREGMSGPLLLEGIVIVLSILLAFALDTWWDERIERSEEIAILNNLEQEFRAAQAQFDFYYGWHERIERAVAQTLQTAREASARGSVSITVPDTAVALVYLSPTFDPRLGTLDGLLASGRLRLIRDPELRHALAGWPGLLREGTEEEEKALRHVATQLDPVFRQRMDISGPLGMLLPLTEGSLSTEQTHAESLMPVDTEVLAVLALRHVHEDHGLDDLGDVHEEIGRILLLIDAQLRG